MKTEDFPELKRRPGKGTLWIFVQRLQIYSEAILDCCWKFCLHSVAMSFLNTVTNSYISQQK